MTSYQEKLKDSDDEGATQTKKRALKRIRSDSASNFQNCIYVKISVELLFFFCEKTTKK